MITIIHTYIDDTDADTDDVATVDNDAWGTNRIQMMLMTMIIQILSFYHDGDGDNGDTGADCQNIYDNGAGDLES